jgi:hypothetical protein
VQKLHEQVQSSHWRRVAGRATVDPAHPTTGRRKEERKATMNVLVRGLTWPIIALLLVGGTHFTAEAVRPELASVFTPATVMPVYLLVGLWAGSRTLAAGGSFVHGLVAGAVLGVLPVVLQLVGFGMILGREAEVTSLSAAFGFLGILWGGILGSGYAMSTQSA